MALPLLLLENRISQALELIPSPHRLPPQDEELFATLEEGKNGFKVMLLLKALHLLHPYFRKEKQF